MLAVSIQMLSAWTSDSIWLKVFSLHLQDEMYHCSNWKLLVHAPQMSFSQFFQLFAANCHLPSFCTDVRLNLVLDEDLNTWLPSEGELILKKQTWSTKRLIYRHFYTVFFSTQNQKTEQFLGGHTKKDEVTHAQLNVNCMWATEYSSVVK